MDKLAEFIAMNEEAAKSALDMGRDVAAAAEVAAEADRGLADAAIEAAAATRELADAQAAAIAKKLEEAAAAHAAGDADRALAADAELASHGVDSLRDALGAVDGDLGKAIGMMNVAGDAIDRMGADAGDAGAKIRAAFVAADDAIDDAVHAFERAGAAISEYDGDASKLVGVQEAVRAAVDSVADAVDKSARAMELATGATAQAAGADRDLGLAALEAAEGASAASHAMDEEARVVAAVAAAIDAAAAAAREDAAATKDMAAADLEAAAAAAALAAAERELAAQMAAEVRGARAAIATLTDLAQEEFRLGASMAVVEDAAHNAADELDDLAVANVRVIAASKEAGAAAREAALEIAAGAATADEAVDRAVDAALRLTAAERTAADAAETLRNKITEATAGMIVAANAAKALAEADAVLAAGEKVAAEAADTHAGALTLLKSAASSTVEAFNASDRALADSAKAATQATGFWARWGSVIHWVISGSIEFLATAIPAIVAFGGAMLVGMQGAQMLQIHLQSLWDAAEATGNVFGQTMGTMLGLKSVLQQAQNAANPKIYALLGAGLGIVKEQAGGLVQAGTRVIQVFDEFAARLQYDFSKAGGAGNTMGALLKAMVPDLIEFGQVFGNLGHAIANFASKMPGLAEVLLKLLDVFSRVILWVSKLPKPLIETAMAMEEIWRWGVPLVAILTKIPIALEAFVASGFGVVPVVLRIAEVFKALVGVIPTLIADFSELAAAGATGTMFEGLANAVAGFSSRLAAAVEEMTVFEALAGTVLVGAMVAVGVALDRTRSSTEQFEDSFNRMIATAKNVNVMTYIATDFQTATARINEQSAALNRYSPVLQMATTKNAQWTAQLRGMEGPLAGSGQGAENFGDKVNIMAGRVAAAIPGLGALGRGYEHLYEASHAADAVQQLTATEQQQVNAMKNVSDGMGYLQEKYHVTAQGALALADAAGVKLASGLTGASEAAVINRTMIEDLVQGYNAMGQSTGEVGTDMTALSIQSSLAASKVSQLNQAWDQFMQTLTGGTSGLAGFEISLSNMGKVTASASQNLAKYTGSMNSSVSNFATSLQSFTGKGAAAWQQFDQVVGSTGPQLIDWLRTAGQEGALGANSQEKFTQAIRDMSAQMVPFASKSSVAKAELMGMASAADANITKWPAFVKWLKEGHDTIGGLSDIIGGASKAMENMGQVAQQLGSVMDNELAKMMDAVKLKAYGVQNAFQQLGNALSAIHPDSSEIESRFTSLMSLLKRVFGPTQGEQLANAFVHQFGDTIKNGMVVPIKNAQNGGAATAGGLAKGLTSGLGPVESASHNLFNATTTTLAPLPAHLHTTGSQAGQGMHDGLSSQTPAIHGWGATVISVINASLGGLPGVLLDIGARAAESFASGLASKVGDVISAAASLAAAVPSKILNFLEQHSPSRVMMRIGEDAASGFAIGLTNGTDDVTRAAHQLADAASGGLAIGVNGVPLAWEAQMIGKDTVRELIAGLTGSKSQITAAIKDITDAAKRALQSGLNNAGTSGWKIIGDLTLLSTISDDNKKLQALADQRTKIMKEIKAAEQYAASVTSSMESEAGIGNLTQPTSSTGATLPWTAADISSGLTSQLKQLQAFDHNIDVLRKMGLSKQLIAQIVAAGYQQGGALAQALAHGSEAQIKSLNATEAAIIKASKKIGKDSADSMYDAGKDAGKGFLSGLKAEEKAIDAEMKKIADDIVKAIRKALRSKSPSMEMHDVGMDAALGLAKGLADGTPLVVAAARRMAEAVSSVKVQIAPVSTHPLVPATVHAGGGGGAPVVIVHQHIAGSVLAQQQLQQHTQTAVLQYAHRNQGNGLFLQGRASGAPVH